MVAFSDYDEAVAWVTGLMNYGIRPGLKRMELLLDRLDHPERKLKFIHVAGTNGKGSVCAYLTSVLIGSGYDVGTFTSPFIERFTSRFQFNGQHIADEHLLQLLNELKPLYDEMADTELGAPTMFEICTSLALLYYTKIVYPDYVVWETGLGGRLDCTNVVTPLVSVITNVGHDHMDILGDTLEKVAAEKAGIIKPGVPVVTAVAQGTPAHEVIREAARSGQSTLYSLDQQFGSRLVSRRENEQVFDFSSPFRSLSAIRISMNGLHQIDNASVALMVLEILRQYMACLIEDETLYASMAATFWPGRLEMVVTSPVRILLDGAHNLEGAATLSASLKDVYTYRKLYLILGMLQTKSHSDYLQHILPLVDTIVITEPFFRKKKPAADIAECAEHWRKENHSSLDIVTEPDWKRAVETVRHMAREEDLIVVAGSLYLISDVRSWLLHHTESEKGW